MVWVEPSKNSKSPVSGATPPQLLAVLKLSSDPPPVQISLSPTTVNAMTGLLVRCWASEMVTSSDLPPRLVPGATVKVLV